MKKRWKERVRDRKHLSWTSCNKASQYPISNRSISVPWKMHWNVIIHLQHFITVTVSHFLICMAHFSSSHFLPHNIFYFPHPHSIINDDILFISSSQFHLNNIICNIINTPSISVLPYTNKENPIQHTQKCSFTERSFSNLFTVYKVLFSSVQ